MTEIPKPPQHLLDALKEVEQAEEGAEYGAVSSDAATKNDEPEEKKTDGSAVKVRKTI